MNFGLIFFGVSLTIMIVAIVAIVVIGYFVIQRGVGRHKGTTTAASVVALVATFLTLTSAAFLTL